MMYQNRVFDTRVDTKKIFVPMNTRIVKRNYVNTEGLSPLYLHITGTGKRQRLFLDIYVNPKKWDSQKENLKMTDTHDKDINLILGSIKSKVNGIKIHYRLAQRHLSIDQFIEEFKNEIPRMDFIGFFRVELNKDRSLIKHGTYKRYMAVLRKLGRFKKQIYFTNIDQNFIHDYKVWCSKKGNNSNTITSNLKVIKQYLGRALKHGIKIPINIDEIKPGSFSSNRIHLNSAEIKKLYLYYQSGFIKPLHKIVTGYFLFSCFTGLRISDVQKLKREDLLEGSYSIITEKTGKVKTLNLNKTAINVIQSNTELFVKKLHDVSINRELKEIATLLGIKKHVSFHVARHSFATNFLKVGGQVERLQVLLGHSNIRETMIYVHIIEEEINQDAMLLDSLITDN